MKILFLSDDFPPESFGGAGIVASNLAYAMAQKGHDVIVLTTTKDPSSVGESILNGIKIITLHSDYHQRYRNFVSVINLSLIFKIKRIIKEIRPDIVHAHNIHSNLSMMSLMISKKYSKAVFMTAHDSNMVSVDKVYPINNRTDYKISFLKELKIAKFRFNPFRRILIKYILSYVDCIFSVSESLRLNLKANGIKKIITVHNGIDVDQWNPDRFDLVEDKNTILFSGRLSGGKGAMQILHALKIVVAKIPDAELLVLGKKGEYTDKMSKFINENNLGNNVKFTGWVVGDDVKKAYKSSSLVVLPSIYLDPFPTVNLEAQAMSKAVVGTCFGGTSEVVQDGKTGYIVNPFDLNDLSGRIIQLLLDEKLRENMGIKGREIIKKDFTQISQVDKILNLYNNFLKNDRK